MYDKIIKIIRQSNGNINGDLFTYVADKLHVEKNQVSKACQEMLIGFFASGLAYEKNFDESNADADELAKGTKIEFEHTSFHCIAKKIALDHISEHPKYYTDPDFGLIALEQKLSSKEHGEKESTNAAKQILEASIGGIGGIESAATITNEVIYDHIKRHYGDTTGAATLELGALHMIAAMKWLYNNKLLTKLGYETYKNEIQVLQVSDEFRISSSMLKETAKKIFEEKYDEYVKKFATYDGTAPSTAMFDEALGSLAAKNNTVAKMNDAVNYAVLGEDMRNEIFKIDNKYYAKLKSQFIENMLNYYEDAKIQYEADYEIDGIKARLKSVMKDSQFKSKLLLVESSNPSATKRFIRGVLLDYLFLNLYIKDDLMKNKITKKLYRDNYKHFKMKLVNI